MLALCQISLAWLLVLRDLFNLMWVIIAWQRMKNQVHKYKGVCHGPYAIAQRPMHKLLVTRQTMFDSSIAFAASEAPIHNVVIVSTSMPKWRLVAWTHLSFLSLPSASASNSTEKKATSCYHPLMSTTTNFGV